MSSPTYGPLHCAVHLSLQSHRSHSLRGFQIK